MADFALCLYHTFDHHRKRFENRSDGAFVQVVGGNGVGEQLAYGTWLCSNRTGVDTFSDCGKDFFVFQYAK